MLAFFLSAPQLHSYLMQQRVGEVADLCFFYVRNQTYTLSLNGGLFEGFTSELQS